MEGKSSPEQSATKRKAEVCDEDTKDGKIPKMESASSSPKDQGESKPEFKVPEVPAPRQQNSGKAAPQTEVKWEDEPYRQRMRAVSYLPPVEGVEEKFVEYYIHQRMPNVVMINSYNNFLSNLTKFNKTFMFPQTEDMDLFLKLSDITLERRAPISKCLPRGLTYEVTVMCKATAYMDIHGKSDMHESQIMEVPIYLCTLPIMVGSMLCKTEIEEHLPHGGYFIINGQRKVLLMSKARRKNKTIVYEQNRGGFKAEAKVISYRGKLACCTKVCLKEDTILVNLGRSDNESQAYPLADFLTLFNADLEQAEKVLKRGLTTKSSRDIVNLCCSVAKTKPCTNAIMKKFRLTKLQNPQLEIGEKVMPHVQGSSGKKALYLCYMANQLLLSVEGSRPFDEPEHLENHMIQGPGQILEDQINNVIQQQFHRIEKTL